MRKTESILIVFIGILFLSLLISGGYLAYRGGPYNSLVVNVHKIFSLLAIILTAATIYRLSKKQ